MAYFVAILTPDCAWSYVMQCTFPTERTWSIISMVSISLEGFLPSILLLVVIIVAVVIVAVILVVVVIDAIVRVVIVIVNIRVVFVVMIIGMVIVDGGVSHIIKLSFVIIVTFPSMLWGSPPMKASIIFSVFVQVILLASDSVPIGIVGICHGSSLCFQGYSNTLCNQLPDGSLGHSWVQRKEFKTSRDRYGNSRMSDPIEVSLSEISLEGNKSWESNIGDSDNTRDEGKIAGRAITTWGGGMISYACMTSIFESSCKGKKTSISKRYLVKLFEESGEMLPSEAEK
nr:hypothetical protein [Tanacetum cinerariifolium]